MLVVVVVVTFHILFDSHVFFATGQVRRRWSDALLAGQIRIRICLAFPQPRVKPMMVVVVAVVVVGGVHNE